MQPPAPNPQLGGRAQRAEARERANENVRKAEQERQQASSDAARNPGDAAKQAKDLEAQQKLDQTVTDAAKLNDDVRAANQRYQDAYQAAEKAANNPNASLDEVGKKIHELGEARKNYEATLEAEKARNARVNAPNWNRQRFAEQIERQRRAPQPGAPGTPQAQPGGTPTRTGTGDIGQTPPPKAGEVAKINPVTDPAGGGEGYNVSGFKFGWSGAYGKDDWSLRAHYTYKKTDHDLPPGGSKGVEDVKVCDDFGPGFFYIPGTDTCLKISGPILRDPVNHNHVNFEILTDVKKLMQFRPREPVRQPVDGAEKNTESGAQDGPLRCFPNNGGCNIPVPREQRSAYGIPETIYSVDLGLRIQVRYHDYQYGSSVAETTGQPAHPPVPVPQGFQADAYDFSIGDRSFRRFGHRCIRGLRSSDFVNILQMTYSRTEDDPGRDKEPALDAGAAVASGQPETLPQARLDLRPPSTRMRAGR